MFNKFNLLIVCLLIAGAASAQTFYQVKPDAARLATGCLRPDDITDLWGAVRIAIELDDPEGSGCRGLGRFTGNRAVLAEVLVRFLPTHVGLIDLHGPRERRRAIGPAFPDAVSKMPRGLLGDPDFHQRYPLRSVMPRRDPVILGA